MTTKAQHKALMPISQVMDFYYAEAIASETQQARNWRAGERLVQDAAELRNQLADYLAPALYNYLIVACWGEAEHYNSEAAGMGFIKNHFSLLRALTFDRECLVETLRCLFVAQEWDGAFGGRNWGHICSELQKVGSMPKVAWVDHLIDLEHNGGSAFDKDDEARVVNVAIDTDTTFFLNFKAHKDILTKEDRWVTLSISREIKQLVSRYHNVFEKQSKRPDWFEIHTADRYIVPYKQPKWGTTKANLSHLCLPANSKWNKRGVEQRKAWWEEDEDL